jgi:hypothetical protein
MASKPYMDYVMELWEGQAFDIWGQRVNEKSMAIHCNEPAEKSVMDWRNERTCISGFVNSLAACNPQLGETELLPLQLTGFPGWNSLVK